MLFFMRAKGRQHKGCWVLPFWNLWISTWPAATSCMLSTIDRHVPKANCAPDKDSCLAKGFFLPILFYNGYLSFFMPHTYVCILHVFILAFKCAHKLFPFHFLAHSPCLCFLFYFNLGLTVRLKLFDFLSMFCFSFCVLSRISFVH